MQIWIAESEQKTGQGINRRTWFARMKNKLRFKYFQRVRGQFKLDVTLSSDSKTGALQGIYKTVMFAVQCSYTQPWTKGLGHRPRGECRALRQNFSVLYDCRNFIYSLDAAFVSRLTSFISWSETFLVLKKQRRSQLPWTGVQIQNSDVLPHILFLLHFVLQLMDSQGFWTHGWTSTKCTNR